MLGGMTYDVVVAGAGPVGLMTAGELALRGASVLVVERRTEPDATIRAGGVNAATMAAFDRRGLLPALRVEHDAALAKMAEFRTAQGAAKPPPPKAAGHFGGIFIPSDLIDPHDPWLAGVDAPVTIVSQRQVEHILAGWVAELGVEVRRGVAVTAIEQTPSCVRVTAGPDVIEARWLVGADGGRSSVRKLAGFDFPGTDPMITGYQAVVAMTGHEQLRPGWNATGTGLYVHGPLPGRIMTVEFDGPPADRDAPITAAELQGSLRHTSGVPVTITEVLNATRFTDNARQATTYRAGRVLLAGDAAHVHSPFGGQGLNLGIGDAVNLGWKLAAVLRGWAPQELLDTYTTERHPVGAAVLDWSRSQVHMMRPEPYARALRQVIDDLIHTPDGAGYMAGRISGLRLRYDLGSDDPLVGRFAADLTLDDGTRLADHQHDGRGVLIDPSSSGDDDDRLVVLRTGVPGLKGLLVRPDGVVAWAGDPPTRDAALRQWFGR